MKGREEPLLNCRFRVDIDGISRSGFSEVSLFHACTEWIEYSGKKRWLEIDCLEIP
jgi:hypothetical protein